MHRRILLSVVKWRGAGKVVPPRASVRQTLFAMLGAFVAIFLLQSLSDLTSLQMMIGSFGATVTLLFGYPELPFSQPRNIVGGHVLGSLTGLLFFHLFGVDTWVIALAVAIAILLMMILHLVHPPAIANTVVVFFAQPDWSFLLFPTLVGAVLLVLIAIIYHNVRHDVHYPNYW